MRTVKNDRTLALQSCLFFVLMTDLNELLLKVMIQITAAVEQCTISPLLGLGFYFKCFFTVL